MPMMKVAFYLTVLLLVWVLQPSHIQAKSHAFSHIEYERLKFLNTFEKTCKKYKFYDTFMNNLKHPRSKHVTFVLEEKGFRNGGFGDRLAGLIHAAGVALMTNRTLVIQSSEQFGFHRLFRPYAPDINTKYEISEDPTKGWKKNDSDVPWTHKWGQPAWSWSNFNPNMMDNDNNEYDLYFCINNGGGGTARRCGLYDGDVPQSIIKFRSNRCYLCHIDNDPNIKLHRQWRDVLGIPENANLFEVAGCLLRLNMWPTEELWGYIDEQLDAHKRDLVRRGDFPAGASGGNGWQSTLAVHYRCGDVSWSANAAKACVAEPGVDYSVFSADYRTTGTPVEEAHCATKVIQSLISNLPDIKEFVKESANENTNGVASDGSHKILLDHLSDLVKRGAISPNEYQEVVDLVSALPKRRLQSRYVRSRPDEKLGPVEHDKNSKVTSDKIARRLESFRNRAAQETIASNSNSNSNYDNTNKNVLVYLTSDSLYSIKQVNETLHWPNTYMSSSSCHLEWQNNFDCLKQTILDWFMLGISDAVIMQAEGVHPNNVGTPKSAYSRYAAVYGLQPYGIREARVCAKLPDNASNATSTAVIARMQQGNWWCQV